MTSDNASTESKASGSLPPQRQWVVLAVLLLPVLIISIDNTVLGFAVPALSEDLAPTSGQLLWIVDVYAFMLAGLLVTMGTLGDRIGRRRLLLIGAAAFGGASAMAAFAPTAELLIVARGLLGVAGATLMPSTLSIIRNVFVDVNRRRIAIAIWTAGFAIGAAIGPVLGGWLLQHFWWGSVFLINLPVMAVLLLLAPLLIPESRDPSPGRYDLFSSGLSLAAMLPIVYVIKKAAESGLTPWLGLVAAVGVTAGVAFVQRQRRLADPMLDVSLFKSRPFSVAVGVNLLGNFALIGGLFFIAQYLQLVLGLSPLESGLHLAPGMVVSMVASITGGVLLRQGIPVNRLLSTALGVGAVGYAVMVGLPVEGGGGRMVIAMMFIGFGVGAATSVGANLVMGAVPAARAGAASAVSETAFELGAATGTAILGSVVTAIYRRGIDLPAELAPAATDAVRETLGGALQVAAGLDPAVADTVLGTARVAFTDGVHAAGAVGALLMAGAAVTAAVLLRGANVNTPAPEARVNHNRD